MNEPGGMHQVHPLTIVYEVFQWIRQMAVPLVILVIIAFQGGDRSDANLEVVFGGLAGLRVVWATVNFLVSRWGFEGQVFRWRTGVIFKQDRQIPLDRIQNVEIVRNVGHRMLGLAQVKIDTGVGGEAEVQLSSLSVADAERLQQDLLARRIGGFELPGEAPIAKQVFWQATTRDLVLAGLTENRAFVILGSFFGLFTFGQFGSDALEQMLWSQAEGVMARAPSQSVLARVGFGILGLLLVGWIFGIVATLIKFYGFSITQKGDRLVREYGLATKMHTAIVLRRVQSFVLVSTWMKRRVGFWEAKCTTAGGIQIDTENRASTDLLCPTVPSEDQGRFLRLVFPTIDLDAVAWRPVSRLTIRRHAVAYSFWWLVLIAGLAVNFQTWYAFWGFPVTIGLALWTSQVRYRWVGYGRTSEAVLVRTGVAKRSVFVIPYAKIQVLNLAQSPFQRRAGLANLNMLTAGTAFGGIPQIEDLPIEEATELLHELQAAASQAGMWQLDGV